MIKINQRASQVRIDTTIKVIEKDGTEVIAPVTVLVDISRIETKYTGTIYKLAGSLFNKTFLLDRIKIANAKQAQIEPQLPQPMIQKKPWYKIW